MLLVSLLAAKLELPPPSRNQFQFNQSYHYHCYCYIHNEPRSCATHLVFSIVAKAFGLGKSETLSRLADLLRSIGSWLHANDRAKATSVRFSPVPLFSLLLAPSLMLTRESTSTVTTEKRRRSYKKVAHTIDQQNARARLPLASSLDASASKTHGTSRGATFPPFAASASVVVASATTTDCRRHRRRRRWHNSEKDNTATTESTTTTIIVQTSGANANRLRGALAG